MPCRELLCKTVVGFTTESLPSSSCHLLLLCWLATNVSQQVDIPATSQRLLLKPVKKIDDQLTQLQRITPVEPSQSFSTRENGYLLQPCAQGISCFIWYRNTCKCSASSWAFLLKQMCNLGADGKYSILGNLGSVSVLGNNWIYKILQVKESLYSLFSVSDLSLSAVCWQKLWTAFKVSCFPHLLYSSHYSLKILIRNMSILSHLVILNNCLTVYVQ